MHGVTISRETFDSLAELAEEYGRRPRLRPYIAEKACDLVQAFAPWWLTAEALAQASRSGTPPADAVDPARFTTHGLARILCLWPTALAATIERTAPARDGARLLRDACVLPVRWVLGASRPVNPLPDPLAQLAETVRCELREVGLLAHGQEVTLEWCLGPYRLKSPIEFCDVQLSLASGFVPLASALIVAANGGEPAVGVWSTGAWNAEFNFCENVDGVPQKVRTALSFGAEHVFVPSGNYHEAAREAARPEQVHALAVGPSLDRVLAPLLVAYRAEPPANASYEEKRAYYVYTAEYDPSRARRYYDRALLEDVAARVTQRMDAQLCSLVEGRCALVTVASQSPGVVLLAALVFRPCRIVLVYDDAQAAKQVNDELRQRGYSNVVCLRLDEDHLGTVRQLAAKINECTAGLPVIIDLTPGSKSHTLALYRAPVQRAHRVYLRNRWTQPSRKGARGIEDPDTMQYVTVTDDQ